MRILVTGGAGFIGSNLIARLVSDGHDVISIDNYSTGSHANEIPGCQYMNADIRTDMGTCGTPPEVIFHLAALARIRPSFVRPSETFSTNVVGTEAVLEYARQVGATVVYAGSSSRWHAFHNIPYATSKYLGEELCKMYRRALGLRVHIARFYNVYGPNEIMGGDYATVIGIWRQQIRDGLPISIIGDGEQRRDFTHVNDIVDGLVRIMETEHVHEDAWELGTGTNYSINELFQMFSERYPGLSMVRLPDQPGNYRATLREHDVAITLLGWNPVDQLRTYICGLV
jgi:UDP-glucose 4-epimerase